MDRRIRGHALARCIGVAVSAILAFFCLDAAVFRSGLYKPVVSPDSSAGSLAWMIRIEQARILRNPRRVLVLGNSQQAEGFSARTAGQVLTPEQIDIVNAGVPGLTARDWFYALRDLDPEAKRYNVIAIPFTDYADLDYQDLQAGRTQDLNFDVGSLRLRDLKEFSGSFPAKDRWIVFRGALFEGLTYREDVRDFLLAPHKRLAAMAAYRANGMKWQDEYGGLEKTLAGMIYDPAAHEVKFPAGIDPATEQLVRDRLATQGVSVRGDQRAFLRHWLGAILERYRGKDVRFVVFRMPQYPVHLDRWKPDANCVVAGLRRDQHVIVLPEEEFDWLEDPQYASDGIHLNSKGRAAFSTAFGKRLGEILRDFQPSN